jgi:uncharacterized membrane protein
MDLKFSPIVIIIIIIIIIIDIIATIPRYCMMMCVVFFCPATYPRSCL